MTNILYRNEFKNFTCSEYKDTTDINQIYEEDSKFLTFGEPQSYHRSHPIFTHVRTYNDEETFNKNFNNPLFSLFSTKILIVVEEKEEKVSFKFFQSHFEKKVGNPWYRIGKHVDYITVNRKTGDVYNGFIHNYNKKRNFTKAVRKNYFHSDALSNLCAKIKNYGNHYITNAAQVSNDASNAFIDSIIKSENQLPRIHKLFKFYLDKRGFKYPNNFYLYKNFHWTKDFRKILKKNENKLVDSLMILHGVHGKKIKKCIHLSTHLNIENYVVMTKLFGDNWLSQSEDAILKVLNYQETISPSIIELKEYLTKDELRKVFKMIVNFVCNNEINTWTFTDHVSMYLQLKRFGENDIKWKSDGSDYKYFSEEHLDWTDKIDHYKRGTYQREYPSYFLSKIQQPINGFYPVILKSSNEYNSESLIQSNCVKSYIGRPGSFIVSLRKSDSDSNVRITIEYRIVFLKNSEKVYAERVQTLGKYNQPIEDYWKPILLKLDEIVLSCHQDEIFESVRITKECSNGVVLKSDSHFDENGILRWSYKQVDENSNQLW